MNTSTILQAHLLDIIFENRNKDYGAYDLRKSYNHRVLLALSIMLGFVLLFSIANYFFHPLKDTAEKPFVFETKEYETSKFYYETKKKLVSFSNKSKKKTHAKPETTPRIVDDKSINKSVASILPDNASQLIQGDEPLDFGNGEGANGNFAVPKEEVKVIEKIEKKPEIYSSADVMPQFPGGLKALNNFLKKNIKAPDEVEEGTKISVKVRFVVDITGQLQSFKVVNSGGEIFDNEVLPVLKKMPQWIPGKSKGKNVAVYFIVPVIFTAAW
jgi:protein TonB